MEDRLEFSKLKEAMLDPNNSILHSTRPAGNPEATNSTSHSLDLDKIESTSVYSREDRSARAPASECMLRGKTPRAKPPITARLLQPQEDLEDILNKFISKTTVMDSGTGEQITSKEAIYIPSEIEINEIPLQLDQTAVPHHTTNTSFLEMVQMRKVRMKRTAQGSRIFINSSRKKF